MTIEEITTGKTWAKTTALWASFLVSHGAVVFAVPALILFTLMLLVLLYDSVVIALEVKKSFDEDEENADEGKAWDEGDDEGGGHGFGMSTTRLCRRSGGYRRSVGRPRAAGRYGEAVRLGEARQYGWS